MRQLFSLKTVVVRHPSGFYQIQRKLIYWVVFLLCHLFQKHPAKWSIKKWNKLRVDLNFPQVHKLKIWCHSVLQHILFFSHNFDQNYKMLNKTCFILIYSLVPCKWKWHNERGAVQRHGHDPEHDQQVTNTNWTHSWTRVRWEPSDLAQHLQDGDGGALAKNESSADKCNGPPKREEDSDVNRRDKETLVIICIKRKVSFQ